VTAGDPRYAWTEPGAFQVLPGVHRIPLPLPSDGLRAVNVYAIEDGDSAVMIDSGWALAEARDRLVSALALVGLELGDIRRFLITHVHRDHYTQAIALRREFGTRVSLSRDEEPTLRVAADPSHPPFLVHLERLHANGAEPVAERLRRAHGGPSAERGIWELPDDWIDGEQEIALEKRSLHALPTPGHTRGHVVFRDEEAGALFAGDHVLPHITPSIGFEGAPAEMPLRDYLGSLRTVRALPDMTLLPAHGPVTDSVHARVDELLLHHDDRLEASLHTISAGATTAYESACILTWTRRDRHFDELDVFSQMLAVNETAAHLDLLVAQGRLRSDSADGVTRYGMIQPPSD
jgi:glyoxylase-like metal-dependent hydrolase (beta-lactamase superfamily II)